MKSKKITLMALSISLAMILSFVESQIPVLIAIPGVKIGLANIVVVFALYRLGWKEAVLISFIRVFLISILFGSAASLFYSVAGAVLSLTGMILLKKAKIFSCVSVSIVGGVLHNVGQIAMAFILLETSVVKYYLPFLIFSGVASGIVIGLLAAAIISRVDVKM